MDPISRRHLLKSAAAGITPLAAAFTAGAAPLPTFSVIDEQPFRFAARYLAHDGPLDPARADAALDEFSALDFPF